MKKKKYIDAEKLKDEIQRRFKELQEEYERTASFRCDGGMDELDKLEQFIDSLQKEQPDADLEAEVDKYLVENYTNDTDVETPFLKRMFSHDRNDLVQFARHFAEWGAVHLNAKKEEKI